MSRATIFSCLLLAVEARFEFFHNTQPTPVNEETALQADGVSPWPTTAPNQYLVEAALRKRQNNDTPNPTCGFFGGISESSLTCASGYCAFNTKVNAAGCCQSYYTGDDGSTSLTDCVIQTACYDSTAVGVCDIACQLNTGQLLCTTAEAPYCYEYTYPQVGISAFGCGTASTILSLSTDYEGGSTAINGSGTSVEFSSFRGASTATPFSQSQFSVAASTSSLGTRPGAAFSGFNGASPTNPFSQSQASGTPSTTMPTTTTTGGGGGSGGGGGNGGGGGGGAPVDVSPTSSKGSGGSGGAASSVRAPGLCDLILSYVVAVLGFLMI